MPFTDADIVAYFEEKADLIIEDNLVVSEDDPDEFADLRNGIVKAVLDYCKRMRKALQVKSAARGTSTSGGKSRSGRPYATFVRMMGALKRGELDSKFLDYEVTPGDHYNRSKKENKSADRYDLFISDGENPLNVDGVTQSLQTLHETLSKYPGMGNTVTLTGVLWGLLEKDTQVDLTSKFLKDHPPAAAEA